MTLVTIDKQSNGRRIEVESKSIRSCNHRALTRLYSSTGSGVCRGGHSASDLVVSYSAVSLYVAQLFQSTVSWQEKTARHIFTFDPQQTHKPGWRAKVASR